MSAALRLTLFGLLELTYADRALKPPASQVAVSLLGYLALQRNQASSRDRLVGIFLQEKSEARARRSLSQALWQIRSTLGLAANRLVCEPESVTLLLQAEDWLDVAEFQEKAQSASRERIDRGLTGRISDLCKAIELYRGDFLENIYDDWALFERERLREQYLNALGRLVGLQKQQGNYEQALEYARKLYAADPLGEEIHRELMRLYHLSGRPQAAIDQFMALREMLAREFAAQPAPSSLALYQQIAASEPEIGSFSLPSALLQPALITDPARLPFVGRAKERQALLTALQSAARGQGGVILVEGEAGVGKSRLLNELVADARWRDFQTSITKADQIAASAPHQLIRDALTPLLTPLRITQLAELVEPVWLAAIASVFPVIREQLPQLPELAPLEPQEENQRLWDGLGSLLTGITQLFPLVLVIEDIQWADQSSLAALPRLAASISASRALILFSVRTHEARERPEAWEMLEALDRPQPLPRLRLEPFGLAECAALVRQALGLGQADAEKRALIEAFSERLQNETGGNAFFLIESLKSLVEGGALSCQEDGEWRLPPADQALPKPETVGELVSQRLERLPSDLRAILELVAALGEQASFRALTQAGDLPPGTLASVLEILSQRGFLVQSQAGYRFGHDLMQTIVYQGIETQRRKRLHLRAGEALENCQPERAETLALHFELAEQADRALPYLKKAGEQAHAVYAYRAALGYYDRALSLAAEAALSRAEHFDLLVAHEAILDILGERGRQAADLEMMIQLAGDDPTRVAKAYRRKSAYLALCGQMDEAQAAARQALELAEQGDDRLGMAAAQVAWGRALDWAGEPAQALTRLQSAADLYHKAGDARGEARARFALGGALLGVKDYPQAEAAFEKTLALYAMQADRLGEGETLSSMGILHMERGDSELGIKCYQRALQIMQQIGYRYGEARAMLNLGTIYYMQGQLAQALEHYDQAVRLLLSLQNQRGEAQARVNRASVRCSALGYDPSCLEDAQIALEYNRSLGDEIGQGQCLSVLGQIQMLQGDLAEARKHLEEGLALLEAAGEKWIGVQVRLQLALLELWQSQPEAALQRLETAEEICEALGMGDMHVNALALRGQALLMLGETQAALQATTQAVDRLTPGVEQGHVTLFRHYQALQACNRLAEAAEMLDRSYARLQEAIAGLSPEQRQISLKRVPEHRLIHETWISSHPQTICVNLPRAGTPSGRPLRPDEWVAAFWTVTDPADAEISDPALRRQARLARLAEEAAQQGAAPTVKSLAQALGVNERTVRRDLQALRQVGRPVRTRGARAPR